jgi:hypothetical protein
MAQVYPRIQNPFMPQGTPDKTNSPTPFYAPGEIGSAFNDQSSGGSYLRVRLDSGATSSTSVGAVAAGQLAFWKDQSQALVTNDKNQCDVGPSGAINRVAGIFQLAVTAAPGINDANGNPVTYVCDLVIQKRAYPVQANGTILAGTYAIADTTANTARVISQSTVTTAPVSQVIGVCANSVLGAPGPANTTPVDINIGFVD